jgi:hypothetical protein
LADSGVRMGSPAFEAVFIARRVVQSSMAVKDVVNSLKVYLPALFRHTTEQYVHVLNTGTHLHFVRKYQDAKGRDRTLPQARHPSSPASAKRMQSYRIDVVGHNSRCYITLYAYIARLKAPNMKNARPRVSFAKIVGVTSACEKLNNCNPLG